MNGYKKPQYWKEGMGWFVFWFSISATSLLIYVVAGERFFTYDFHMATIVFPGIFALMCYVMYLDEKNGVGRKYEYRQYRQAGNASPSQKAHDKKIHDDWEDDPQWDAYTGFGIMGSEFGSKDY
jgi:hypothetical protein